MTPQHFSVRDVSYQDLLPGIRILATTDVSCHLFMRWTLSYPRTHTDPELKRGAWFPARVRFCFVEYEDNEQEEAGDTLTHTFLKPSWVFCQTRFFYFWGTVAGEVSPSESPIFEKHNSFTPPPFGPEITRKFYSDYHPETSSVDGEAAREVYDQTWAELHDGDGSYAYDSYADMRVRFFTDRSTNLWWQLWRCIFTFDTLEILPGSQIVRANVGLYGSSKAKTTTWKIAPAIYGSHPLSDVALVAADYGNLYDVILSNAIDYDDIDPDSWNIFTLNVAGLAAINKGGITRLGARDSYFDAPNIAPPWEPYDYCHVIFHTAEFGVHREGPYLEVTWREPLA